VKSRILTALPMRAVERTLIVLPKWSQSNVLEEAPVFRWLPIDRVVEIKASFMIESLRQEPTAVKPIVEMAEPTLQ